MNLWQYILKEIRHRRVGFLLGMLSVSVAMAAWIGAVVLLRANDRQTDLLLARRERATQEEMRRLEDDYRRIMRDLGYNVMIVSARQNLAALRAQAYADATLPDEYVERLARGHIATLNHLLPVLQQRLPWPEHGLEIILSGTPGQVPITHLTHFLTPDGKAYRQPIMATIPPGELVIGHGVAQASGLRPGDETTLMGQRFRVRAVNRAEGTTDDIAVWCHLDWVQQQLDMAGKINLILALECVCHADALGEIMAEVNRLLPDVQVMEFSSRVKTRALARDRAAEAHRLAIAAEREHRQEINAAQRRFATVMAPLAVAAATIWMIFLFLGNVRERTIEIGVLRAIGVREHVILAAFILKGALMGVSGAIVGFVAGHAIGAGWAGMNLFSRDFLALLDGRLLVTALLTAPCLGMLAAWFPAIQAIRRDPARILCEG